METTLLSIIEHMDRVLGQKENFSFGNTLRSYGAKSGPYLVLPILGPSNFRDSLSLAVEFYTDPLNQIKSIVDRKLNMNI